MKRTFFLLVLMWLLDMGVYAQKTTRAEYIEKYAKLAVQEMQRTGIPASITLAQACLESNDGNSDLSIASNNHFGIKCHKTWQGERMYHDDDAKGECFRVYPQVYDSYIDHSNFLRNGQRYAFLFEFDKNDFTSWAYGLKRAGYATNPNYPKLLIKIIEDNQLYKYDTMTPEMFQEKKKADEEEEDVVVKGDAPVSTIEPPNPVSFEPTKKRHERNIYTNNGKRFIILQKGETLYSISQKFHIPLWKLYDYNDISAGEVLADSSIVYIEQKGLRAGKEYMTHTVRPGETFQSISQLYAIKANRLARINNAVLQNSLEPGTNIYVRKYAFK